ncbi:MAG: DUF4097 domain-containing protein [Bacteroides sp.]|nr:DUF4097 domain-containing protein [Bacteroides sp.]
MKKGAAKYIVGGSIVAAGLVLVTTAVCIDGWRLFTNFPEVTINPTGVHVFYGGNDYEYASGEYAIGGTDIMETSEIKNVKIDIGHGKVVVKRGNVDKIDIQTKNIVADQFKYEVKGDTLTIKYKKGFTFFSFDMSGNDEITVIFPEDAVYDDMEIDNGAGNMLISDIAAREMDIDNGAGELSLKNVVVDGELDMDTGAGAIKIDTLSCGNLEIESGVGEVNASNVKCGSIKSDSGIGSFSFSGEINGDAYIQNGVGEVKMNVYGSSADYSFKVDSGIGQVKINGNAPVQTSGGKYTFKVSSGVGEVRIDFTDKESE